MGSVSAGRYWGGAMQKMAVPGARKGSWEYLFHRASAADKIIQMDILRGYPKLANRSIVHRAIGVVYDQETSNNYVPSIMPSRYDAFVFINDTTPLHALQVDTDSHQFPDTYPFGF